MANSDRLEALIDGAIGWAESGVPVFPCKGSKAPLTSHGHKDAVTDPAKIRAMFEFYGEASEMVGARMGEESGLFALDFDLYKGDQPKRFMEKLIEDGCLPDSRIHQTMKGGLHVLYRSDSSWPNIVPCPGVEVKGEGGYIIVPPSPGYSVLKEGLIDAPDSLMKVLAIAKDVASTATIDDMKMSVHDASDFHDALRGIAAKLSSRGMDPTAVLIELKAILNASVASHPEHERHMRWKRLVLDQAKELTRIVRSGYDKYNPTASSERARDQWDEHGHQWEDGAADAGFTDSPKGGEEEATVYSDDEWPYEKGYFADEDHDLTQQRFTMYPIFAENESVVLFAEPKTGKTAIALTTALHIACGFDLGAFKVSEAGPTLYYALEGSRAIRLRVSAWRKKKLEEGVELPDRIPMYVVEGHATFLKEEKRKDEANKIIAANNYSIKRGGGALKAVYLDTLTKAMSGGDQNSVEDTSHLFELIGLLRDEGVTGTIIFVHHKSRQGNARGSTNIEAEPDVLLDITKKEDIVEMKVARARSIEDGNSFLFRLSGVDLGMTDQGHPLAGVYAEPMKDVAVEPGGDVGAAQVKARQLELIVGMGKGNHTLRKVMEVFIASGVGPKRGAAAAYKITQVASHGVQLFFKGLIGSGGTVYQNVGIKAQFSASGTVIGVTVL